MNQTNTNQVKNKLGVLLNNTNFPNLEPTIAQLTEMNLSKKRFTQIKLNAKSSAELSYSEAIKITEWLKSLLPDLQPWHLFDYPYNEKEQSHE